MRSPPPTLLVTAFMILAGCSGDSDQGGKEPGGDAAQVPYAALCALGNWEDSCTVRASPNESPSKAEIGVAHLVRNVDVPVE